MCWKFVLFCAQCSRNGHSGPEEDVQLLSWLISYYSSHVSLIPGIPLPLQSCSYKANSHPLFPLLLVCQWILSEEPRISLAEAWNLIPSLVRCCTCVFLAGNIGDYFTGNVVQSGENVSTHPCFPSGFNGGISEVQSHLICLIAIFSRLLRNPGSWTAPISLLEASSSLEYECGQTAAIFEKNRFGSLVRVVIFSLLDNQIVCDGSYL